MPPEADCLDVPVPADVGKRGGTIPANELASLTPQAIAFLRDFAPEGPWVLTAIVPDGGKTYTETFGPKTADACGKWIDSHQGVKNLYFMVNPAIGYLNSKAKKTDVAAMAWLHVDVDPRAGEDLAAERTRAEKILREFEPKPTLIVDSGGGFQAFWKLEEPVPVNGDERKCEELEAYNQQLELLLGGDHCFNLDRIMRLPGTINMPGEKKRKKGREAALAKLVIFNPDRTFKLGQFTAAPRVQTGEDGFTGGGNRVNISGNLPRIEDVSALPVSDRVRMLIVQGHDPDEPHRWGSRSELLFHVLCEMVRAGVDVDTMASVIMDPDFGISASVLDKPRPERYAARQIQRAQEEAVDPWLRKLNDKHMVIGNDGGKCRIAEWVPRYGREQLVFQTFDDFRNRYMNKSVTVTAENGARKQQRVGDWWLNHPMRCEFPGLVFEPGGLPVVNGYLNLWRGYAVEAVPGDWSLMQSHIQQVLAAGNQEHADYIIRWISWAVQNPDKPAEVALVLRGGQGTGKGALGRAMRSLFGQHGLHINSALQFAGRFNAHLRDVCLLFADEAVSPDDRNAGGTLKALLTEPSLAIEGKGRDIVQTPNYVKVIMASNEDFVVPVALDDRRFAVFDVSATYQQDRPYFRTLFDQMEGSGLSAMLHDLLTMELNGWHPRDDIPKTVARNQQKAASLTGFAKIFLDLLQAGELPAAEFHEPGRPFVATDTLRLYASSRLRFDVSWNQVTEMLRQLGAEKVENRRPRGYILPPLPEVRAAWDRVMVPMQWNGPAEWSSSSSAYRE